MKYVWMLVLILLALGGNAVALGYTEWGDTYTYTCTDADGVYRWALRNESPDVPLVDWTWADGRVGGLSGAISLEADFPLPMVTPTTPRPWYNVALYNTEPSVTVYSTLWWADGTSVSGLPIVMPQSAVPEPCGLLVFAVCLTALNRCRKRKR